MKLKTVQKKHWQRTLVFFSIFSPFCLICNGCSAKDFIPVFLEKEVLISQMQTTRLYVVILAVWESREIERYGQQKES